jgi:hypothetical protein
VAAPIGPRGTLLFASNDATCHPINWATINQYEYATSSNFQVTMCTTCHHVIMYGSCPVSCTACPVSTLFFPVWRFEQIAITFSPDVHLRRNELRWVRDDEGYKPICFEAILRTLIFEVKFDPWSRFLISTMLNILLHIIVPIIYLSKYI